jgi:hypothetical protein
LRSKSIQHGGSAGFMTWSAHVVDGPMIADIVDNPLALERKPEKIHRHPPRNHLPR